MITHLAFYAGWPAAMSASKMSKQLYDDKKESK
jgi:alkylhydroperoxidase/carboxymuconolactone decarboxylase family protein YurZ